MLNSWAKSTENYHERVFVFHAFRRLHAREGVLTPFLSYVIINPTSGPGAMELLNAAAYGPASFEAQASDFHLTLRSYNVSSIARFPLRIAGRGFSYTGFCAVSAKGCSGGLPDSPAAGSFYMRLARRQAPAGATRRRRHARPVRLTPCAADTIIYACLSGHRN